MDFLTPFEVWYRMTCWVCLPFVVWAYHHQLLEVLQDTTNRCGLVGRIAITLLGVWFLWFLGPIVVVVGFVTSR